MGTRARRTAILLYMLTALAPPAVAQVDQQRAEEYFKEVRALCERDGGRLWGVSLCGPMVIADVRTKTLATSQPAPDGSRPRLLGLVNAPLEWGGAEWAAYVWDFVLGMTPRGRNELFIHELFHRVQPRLGLTAPARTPRRGGWPVLAAARVARARTGAAGIGSGGCCRRSECARVPPGAARVLRWQH